MHSLPFAVNCSMLFTEIPLLERPQASKNAGFDAVEFWWPFADAIPSAADVAAFKVAIAESEVQLTGINFYAGDMPGGDRGVLSAPGQTSIFRENVALAVDLGASLGCTKFNALYGRRIAGIDPQRQDDIADENLAVAIEAARSVGGTILIEPLSGLTDFPILTVEDAIAVLARIGASPDEGAVLFDLYHLATNGVDVATAIEQHSRWAGHVQIADSPGRHEPGTGSLPLSSWLDSLAAHGYDGWVGLEYAPSTTTLEGLQWLPAEDRGNH